MDSGKYNFEEEFLTTMSGQIYPAIIGRVEKIIIEKALSICSGNKIQAAKMLGLNRNTLHSKIKRLNIDIQRFKI